MAASVYDQLYVYLDGNLLMENVSLSIDLEGDDQDVLTIAKGWAGQTPSPKKTMAQLANVIPPEGQEVDAWKASLLSEKHKMRFQSAATGKTLESEGFIRKPKIAAGVGKTADQNFEFHGTPGLWQ